MTWIVSSPLVLTCGDDGEVQYHYRGAVIDHLTDEAASRLVSEGFIEPMPGAVTRADEAGTQPGRTASVKAWRDYALAQGFDAAEVESMTRQQLIEALG
ncbi:hypothetical protein QSJ18_18230 [Gordonia sp. ABSL1-1]|uniref:hypothetical protein n=1 Tax=Gordonia sp. ABSL1-1 TaxID=3053923 RepID=UPI002572B3D6|nr:hypothetical protein [Gordonia sp. ABSL1-1]MDL9938688.1 hypothetical protein [Gordonia sp. ABSL1-1]